MGHEATLAAIRRAGDMHMVGEFRQAKMNRDAQRARSKGAKRNLELPRFCG